MRGLSAQDGNSGPGRSIDGNSADHSDGGYAVAPGGGSFPRHEVIIVGAGIAGMSAAWSLRERDVVVLEAGDRVGGRMRSEVRGRYWLNLGAHIFKPGGAVAELCRELDLQTVEPQGSFLAVAMHGRIFRATRPEALPLRLPLSPPARLSLVRAGLRMLSAQRQAARFLARGDGSPTDVVQKVRSLWDMTFADLLGPMHPDVEALMRVFANRCGGELHELSALAGSVGFHDLFGGTRANIVSGSSKLPEELRGALGARVLTGAKVTRVEQSPGSVEVEYVIGGQHRLLTADVCIMATPAPVTRELVTNLPDALRAALGLIRYTPFVVAGIFTDEAGAMPWDDLYALAVPGRSFCMFFNPANAVRQDAPRRAGGALVVYAVADRAAKLLELSDDTIRDRYLGDLYDIFPEAKEVVREVVIQRWPLGCTITFIGRNGIPDSLFGPWERICFAGDYLQALGMGMDGSIVSGQQAARSARMRLPKK